MYALFFEVRPRPGHLKHYFEHVEALKPVLEKHSGLLFLDRYRSLTDDDLMLSHQLWESEDAIRAWRLDASHRRSQTAGRKIHFEDYRIRVGQLACRATSDGTEVPKTMEEGDCSQHVIAHYGTKKIPHPTHAIFESVNTAANYISLQESNSQEAAIRSVVDSKSNLPVYEVSAFRVIRDYSMRNRKQAPS